MADQKKYTNKLEGSHILIIGGSSGIGFGVAEASLEFGARVTIASSQQTRIDNAIARLTKAYPSAASRLNGVATDLNDEATLDANVAALFNRVTGDGAHKLDHVVVTAGAPLVQTPLEQASVGDAKQAGMTRFFAPMFIGKHCRAHLRPGPRASVVFTSGTVTQKPFPGWASGAINGGMHMLSRQLALDYAPLRFNIVCPGAVETELWDSLPGDRQALLKGMGAKLPTGRVGRVEDVAEAYLYAMRDENTTGAIIDTNGGALLVG
ncbi:MAG: hypothetical protein M1822_006163 [Bathelium mastoideum]|nr:MAG: hypothetical protein M1822_006163 [Bathelium mastoideum]